MNLQALEEPCKIAFFGLSACLFLYRINVSGQVGCNENAVSIWFSL